MRPPTPRVPTSSSTAATRCGEVMPTTRIRTGLVGFGLAGRVFHSQLLLANDHFSLDLVATVDPEQAAGAATVARHVVSSFDELLAHRMELDLVIIATPPALHVAQARVALAAGLAVVVDKPFTPTVAEGEELIDLAAHRGVLLTVFQSRRWDGDFLTVRDLVTSGTLGRVHRFESAFERWQTNLRVSWHGDLSATQGGGTLYDTGAHIIDQALELFGPATLAYSRVSYLGDRSDDEAVIVLEHESGTLSYLSVSRAVGQTGPRFRVMGSEGGFVCFGVDPQEAALKAGMSPRDPAYGLTDEAHCGVVGVPGNQRPVAMRRGSYPQFYELLADALLDGGPVPVDPHSSVEVIRLIEQAHSRANR